MRSDGIETFESGDPQMEAAISAARDSIEVFLKAFSRPRPGQQSFLLKVAFEHGENREHIWMADLDLSGPRLRGVVANEPSPRFKQVAEFAPAQITDWMYVENGRLMGGFTTRVIRARLSPQERAELDAASPYTF
jgi:uncharacterized protein YegJ (DUF2314 family)